MYVKLFASILTSSVWSESMETRLVWVTMLTLADRDGFVRSSPSGLARSANVPLAACRTALRTLEQPDVESSTQEWAGRRIEAIEGGWTVLNYEKYRDLRDPDVRREQTRERVRKHREGKRLVTPGNAPQPQADTEADTDSSLLAEFTDDSHRDAVETALGGLHPQAVEAAIRALHDGTHRTYPFPVIGRALVELQAAGTTFSAKALDAFCRTIAAGDPSPRVGPHRQTQREKSLAVLDAELAKENAA